MGCTHMYMDDQYYNRLKVEVNNFKMNSTSIPPTFLLLTLLLFTINNILINLRLKQF
jgi:hypothetical protein